MTAVLLVVGSILLFLGFLFSSSATAGVYLATCACFFAVCARIAQADAHHREVHPPSKEWQWTPPPPPAASEPDNVQKT